MSAVEFDPYYKWLGIPAKDQPPTHYRLLSIESLEEDVEVIDAAANRLMAYLHDLSSGDHPEATQKLLNEISAARRCLLNRERKAEYDAELKKQAASANKKKRVPKAKPTTAKVKAVAAPPPARKDPLGIGTPPIVAPTNERSVLRPTPSSSRKRKQRQNQGLTYAALAVVLVGCGGAALFLLTRGEVEPTTPGDGQQVAQADPGASGQRRNPAVTLPVTQIPTPTTPQEPITKIPLDTNPIDQTDIEFPTFPVPLPTDPQTDPPDDLPPESADGESSIAAARQAIVRKEWQLAGQILDRHMNAPDSTQKDLAKGLLLQLTYAQLPDKELIQMLKRIPKNTFDQLVNRKVRAILPMTEIPWNNHLLEHFATRQRSVLDAAREARGEKVDKPDEVAVTPSPNEPELPKEEPPVEPQEPLTKEAAEKLLAEKGLQKSRGGSWELTDEDPLLKEMASTKTGALQALAAPIRAAESANWKEVRKAQKLVTQAKQANAQPNPQAVQIAKRFGAQLAQIDQAASASSARFAEAHVNMTIHVLSKLKQAKRLSDTYQQLSDDPRVQEAIAILAADGSPESKLETSAKFKSTLKKFEKIGEQVLGDFAPVSGNIVATIVNEKYAVPFQYSSNYITTIITSETASRLDIKIPKNARIHGFNIVSTTGTRKVMFKEVKLAQLRFGGHVFSDVKIGILKADDDDLGNQLSSQMFDDRHYKHDVSKFLFTLEDRNKKRDALENPDKKAAE